VAEPAEPRVARFQAPVADQVADIVGELHYPNTDLLKHVHQRDILTVRSRVLEAKDDADPAGLLGIEQLVDRPHLPEGVGVPRHVLEPGREPAHGAVEVAGAHRHVHGRNP
jgi:hypothetical protein